MRIGLIAALLLAWSSVAQANDWIEKVKADGRYIVAGDGRVYEVDYAGQVDSSLWLEMDTIEVLSDGKIVNKSQDQVVDATEVSEVPADVLAED